MKEHSRISPNSQKETAGDLGFQGHTRQYRQDNIWAQPNRIVQTGWFREERPHRQKQNKSVVKNDSLYLHAQNVRANFEHYSNSVYQFAFPRQETS
jgi:hypothetical protein